MGLDGGSLQVLECLGSLRKLGLHQCDLDDAGLDALPPKLQYLSLEENRITAVPVALAPLTSLTELNLGANELAGGWQHLAGMQQLASLSVDFCSLTAVPPVPSQLTALTCLNIGGQPIAGGWQHLAGMVQLANLNMG